MDIVGINRCTTDVMFIYIYILFPVLPVEYHCQNANLSLTHNINRSRDSSVTWICDHFVKIVVYICRREITTYITLPYHNQCHPKAGVLYHSNGRGGLYRVTNLTHCRRFYALNMFYLMIFFGKYQLNQRYALAIDIKKQLCGNISVKISIMWSIFVWRNDLDADLMHIYILISSKPYST